VRRGYLVFISQAGIADPVSVYSCIRVYSIQRYIEKGLVSDIFLEVNKSFYFLYGYVLFVGVK
jgi:hypothetical protein